MRMVAEEVLDSLTQLDATHNAMRRDYDNDDEDRFELTQHSMWCKRISCPHSSPPKIWYFITSVNCQVLSYEYDILVSTPYVLNDL